MIQKAKQTYASQKIQFFVQSAEDYKTLFEKEGFEVESAEILFVTSWKIQIRLWIPSNPVLP